MVLVDRRAIMANENAMVDAHVDFIENLRLLVAKELPTAVYTVLVFSAFVIQKPGEYFLLKR